MKIFVISLRSSIERRAYVRKALKDIDFTFFDADNLSEDPDHFIYQLYSPNKTRMLKGYTLTTTELGCFASHISLWKKCVELNEIILILEDSIELLNDFRHYLSVIDNLAKELGIIKLYSIFHRKTKLVKKVDSKYNVVSNLKGGCGTQAYAITPEVALAYLDLAQNFFEPVDDFIETEWRTKQTVYSLMPELVKRRHVASTIGPRKDKHNLSLIRKFNTEFYRVYKKIRQLSYNVIHK